MICYKDKTFCSAECLTVECHRNYTEEAAKAAVQWWGGEGVPVAFSDFSGNCNDYKPKEYD